MRGILMDSLLLKEKLIHFYHFFITYLSQSQKKLNFVDQLKFHNKIDSMISLSTHSK